jgi:phage-related protein
MPVFTKGIEAARAVLPQLTPLVKAAGTELGSFMDEIKAGVSSGGFKAFMADLAKFAGPALHNFLGAVKNIIVGVGGMIQAFLPLSGQMTGGLNKATAAFARWGASLKGSSGMSTFVSSGKTLGTTLGQVAKAIIGVLVSLQPLLQAASGLGLAFATVINNTPVPVLVAIGKALLIAKTALMAYRAYVAITTFVTGIWTSSIWASTAALLANPITWIVIAIIALIAVIVLIATKTTWFQTAWKYTWNAIKAVTLAVWTWLKSFIGAAIDFLVMIFLNFTGPGLIIKHWNTIKAATLAAWNWIKGAVAAAFNFLKMVFLNFTGPGLIIKHWNTIKTKTAEIFTAVKNFIVGVFSSITNWISQKVTAAKNVASTAFTAIRNTISNAIASAKNAVVTHVSRIIGVIQSIKSKVQSFFSGIGSWLYNSGKSLIQGFINGIKNMIGSVKNAVSSVVSKARDYLPFSPAKEGPFSGTGYTTYSGKALMADWAKGITSNAKAPALAVQSAAVMAQAGTQQKAAPWTSRAATAAGSTAAMTAGYQQLALTIDSSGNPVDVALLKLLQNAIRVRGGNVQTVLGQRGS